MESIEDNYYLIEKQKLNKFSNFLKSVSINQKRRKYM